MPVGIRLKFSGGTQENYDTAHGVMEIDTDPPAGMIVHSAGPIDGGWGVIDFWESREHFESLCAQLRGAGSLTLPAQFHQARYVPQTLGTKSFRVTDSAAEGHDDHLLAGLVSTLRSRQPRRQYPVGDRQPC